MIFKFFYIKIFKFLNFLVKIKKTNIGSFDKFVYVIPYMSETVLTTLLEVWIRLNGFSYVAIRGIISVWVHALNGLTKIFILVKYLYNGFFLMKLMFNKLNKINHDMNFIRNTLYP